MAVLASAMLAFGIPSGPEMIVILGLGVLLFGRRLPEVGRQIGKVFNEFRRGLDSFKREISQDESFREARDGLRDLQRARDIPRKVTDPKRLFDDLTDESRATRAPSPPAKPVADGAPGDPV